MLISSLFTLHQLRRNQWLDAESVRQIQRNKLVRMIAHAYQNVGYYRKLFDSAGIRPEDIRSEEDLVKIPITTRSKLQSLSPDDIVAKNVDLKRCIRRTTAGSSGTPLIVFFRRHDKEYYDMVWARTSLETGRKLWDKVASFRTELPPSYWTEGVALWKKKVISIFDDPMNQIAHLQRLKPDIIQANTLELVKLARCIIDNGVRGITPRLVYSRGSQLDPATREMIRSAYQAPVYDFYGSRELGCMAWECAEHSGYHVNIDALIVEIIREGRPVSPEKAGRIVCTGLQSFAMPFIRYDIGDIGVLSSSRCACGRSLPLLKSIEGRADDFLVASDGTLRSPLILTERLKLIPGIKEFRIIQENSSDTTAHVVPDERYSSSTSVALREVMERTMGNSVSIRIELLDTIPVDRSGKIRSIISKVQRDF